MDIKFYNTDDGIHFPELGLWLDSSESAKNGEIVFVSHAHSDHISKHGELVLSPATSRFLRLKYRRARKEHVMEYDKSHRFCYNGLEYKLTLFPAGHILGSSMLRIEVFNTSILYTGDFKLNGSLTSEPCQVVKSDFLIMESTFGKSDYIFPKVDEVSEQIIRFCETTLGAGKTPVLFSYSLGKSQDLLKILARKEFRIMGHNQVCKMTSVYRDFGIKLPNIERFSPKKIRDKVVIMPPLARSFLAQIEKERIRTAIVTGWAVDKNIAFRFAVDEAFALSDHSDYEELINFVKIVNPRKVYTMHGFSVEFAYELRNIGFDAEALEESGQKWLSLGKHDKV